MLNLLRMAGTSWKKLETEEERKEGKGRGKLRRVSKTSTEEGTESSTNL